MPEAPEPNIVLQTLFPPIQPQYKPLAMPSYTPKTTITLRAPTTTPPQIQLPRMANIPVPSTFEGNETENPQNFIREVERYIYLNSITDKPIKVAIFSTFIYTGSQADIWWNGLDPTKKVTWAEVKKAFETQWPAIVVAAKSQLDYQKELLMLKLKEEEVGKRITVAGVSTWSHLHYHGHLQKLVQDAGVTNAPVFIHQVHEGLPRVIRDLSRPL